jgi:colanic acid/amylovoran biosynthesis glycosyltransferase
MKKETVVIFVEEVFLGPTMTFVINQIKELKKNYNVIIVTNELANEHLFSEPVHLVKLDLFSRILGYFGRKLGVLYCLPPLKMWYKLLSIKNNNNIVCCICHFGTGGLQIGFLLKLLKIPFGVIIHGVDGSALLFNKAYKSQISRLGTANFIFASKSLSNNFQKLAIKTKSSTTINLGIKLSEVKHINIECLNTKFQKNQQINFFQASNFVPKKGHKYTINAFGKFIKKYPKCKLYLAGDGPLKQEIMEQVKFLGIEENVVFMGHLRHEEVINFFENSDIFLHHSITSDNGDQESIPTVIMEAMLFKLPVISTFHSGIPEVIESGINGYLVEERNIEEYVDAMEKAILNSAQISTNARDTIINKFNMVENLKRIVEFSKIK